MECQEVVSGAEIQEAQLSPGGRVTFPGAARSQAAGQQDGSRLLRRLESAAQNDTAAGWEGGLVFLTDQPLVCVTKLAVLCSSCRIWRLALFLPLAVLQVESRASHTLGKCWPQSYIPG